MRANCHFVTEMRLILGFASPPLGKCTGRSDVIALSVKGSRPRDSCSSRCAHFSFQRGSSGETTDSSPVHQYHSQITFFFFQWEAINWNCSTQDAMFDGHLRLSLLPSGKLYVHVSGEQRWSVWFTVPRASGVFDLNFLKSFTTERNILFDPMNFFFFLPRKEVIQWLYGDDL